MPRGQKVVQTSKNGRLPEITVENAPPGWELIDSRVKDLKALQGGRDRLLAGARECFYKKGYGGTSVSEIAKTAGVSIGSFYQYVRSKEDLLWLLAEDVNSKVEIALKEASVDSKDELTALHDGIAAFIRVSDENHHHMEIFFTDFKHMPDACKQRVLERDRELVERFSVIVRRGKKKGEFGNVNPRFVGVLVEMMATTWVLKRGILKMSLDEYITEQQEVATRLVLP
jgi:TetR/AcrR family transcriptional regulator, cholesterol catabolism regulator